MLYSKIFAPTESVKVSRISGQWLAGSFMMAGLSKARPKICVGHNHSMMVITAESQGQTFCLLADLVPTAAHLQPTWVPALDLFPLESIETRIKWLTAAVEGNWLCAFGHDPDIAFARIGPHPKTRFTVL